MDEDTSNEDNEFDRIQYVLCLDSLKSNSVSKAVTISAILVEAPLHQRKICINKFVMYQA